MSTTLQEPSLLERLLGEVVDGIRVGTYRKRDPYTFTRDTLGQKVTRLQRNLITETWKVEKTAAKGGHSTGKTHAVACAALAFLYCKPGSTVIVSSATGRQAKFQIWANMRRVWGAAKKKLPGAFKDTYCRPDPEKMPDWVAIPFSTDKPEFFQGFHAFTGSLMIVADEAMTIDEIMFDAMMGCLAGKDCHIVLLGNPTVSVGTFFDAFQEGSAWRQFTFNCLDHPNYRNDKVDYPGAVTRKWVEDRRREYGEDSVFWRTRVLGEFPKEGVDVLVPRAWIKLARERNPVRAGEPILGCDVARYGTDETAVYVRDGGEVLEWRTLSTSATTEVVGLVIRMAKKHKVDPSNIIIDDSGVGGGVTDGLREKGEGWDAVTPFLFGGVANDPEHYANRKAEIHWRGRCALDPNTLGVKLALPDDKVLLSQMDVKYALDSKGRITIEKKDAYKKRKKGMSPDRFEALLLTFAHEESVVDLDVEWGNEEDYAREQKELVGVFGDDGEFEED